MSLFDTEHDHDVFAVDHEHKVPPRQSLHLAFAAPMKQWVIRILKGAGGLPAYWDSHEKVSRTDAAWISEMLGIDVAIAAKRESLAEAVQAFVVEPGTTAIGDCTAKRNLAWLASSAGLNPVEQHILHFAFALRVFNSLRLATGLLPNLSRADAPWVLCAILDANSDKEIAGVHEALRMRGILMRTAMISTYDVVEGPLTHMLQMPRRLANQIALHDSNPDTLLSGTCEPVPPTNLSLSDFSHITTQTELARHWIKGATTGDKGQVGAHLLVYGAPGLGKTEWVRVLLQSEGIPAQELAVLDDEGDVLSGDDRIKNLKLGMHLLRGNQGGVMVFDEADDAFDGGERQRSEGHALVNHRASINRMLEDSPVPVIWIMNHPEILHPAIVRRFDAVIGFEGMPRSLRLQMLKSRFKEEDGFTESEIQRWADIEGFSPALIDRLDRMVKRSSEAGTPMAIDHCRQWIKERIRERTAKTLHRSQVAETWDPALINASLNPQQLIDAIKQGGVGGSAKEGKSNVRILLHGPSGTGKTAFAKELAKQLDKPLLEKRASDLLSAWLGETEKQLESAFSDALQSDAVLFIDEVDTFLLKREIAQRSWEVSMVNEFLVQLGDFEGIVVLATNRLEALDVAVLRRMDLKVGFSAFTADQLLRATHAFLQDLGLPELDTDQQLELMRIRDLSVGDLAVMRRRMRFEPLGEDPVNELIARLDADARLKAGKTVSGVVTTVEDVQA